MFRMESLSISIFGLNEEHEGPEYNGNNIFKALKTEIDVGEVACCFHLKE